MDSQPAHPEKLQYEEKLWRQNVHRVAGVDEAGRGPLAGPVVAAAVIFHPDILTLPLPILIDDSKKLSEIQRISAYCWITQQPSVHYGVGIVDAAEIDRMNIRQAAMKAMRKAVRHLPVQPAHLLIDGHPLEDPPFPQTAIIRGDQKSLSIAAASIIAKVLRDQIMIDYHHQYPDYFFSHNKGYPTLAHINAILKHGYCPIHRRSFRPKKLQAMGFFER